MSRNIVYQAVFFIMEAAALVAFGAWGWRWPGAWRYLGVVAVPVAAAIIWGVFRVPGEPKDAPVAISGPLRLLLEALFFGAAVAALHRAGYGKEAWIFLGIILVEYALGYDRILRFWSK